MAKKGCVFRNYEYLITVLEDWYSTCACLPPESVTTFTHPAAVSFPESFCIGPVFVLACVYIQDSILAFRDGEYMFESFFPSDSESSIAHHHCFLPLVEAIFIRIIWFAHRRERESIWLSIWLFIVAFQVTEIAGSTLTYTC